MDSCIDSLTAEKKKKATFWPSVRFFFFFFFGWMATVGFVLSKEEDNIFHAD